MGEESKTPKKTLTYKELENIAAQQNQLILQLRQQLAQQNYGNFHQRMAYLFEVVRNADKFSNDFAQYCINEIAYSLWLPKQEDTEDSDLEEGAEGGMPDLKEN